MALSFLPDVPDDLWDLLEEAVASHHLRGSRRRTGITDDEVGPDGFLVEPNNTEKLHPGSAVFNIVKRMLPTEHIRSSL